MMISTLVDSHCHIPMIEHPDGAAGIIRAARDNGVTEILCVAVELDSFPEIRRLAQEFDGVAASVGVHPNASVHQEPDVDLLAALAEDEQVIAIGETGLDYFRGREALDGQRTRFRVHIRAALATGKPLIVHCRDAKDDVLRILTEENAGAVGGIMHCFVDDWDTAQRAMALGFRISLSGIVTFRNARDLQETARRLPADALLMETDAPYLAPVPMRGKQNQPAYVRYVAEFLAELRASSVDEIARQTTGNYKLLFNK